MLFRKTHLPLKPLEEMHRALKLPLKSMKLLLKPWLQLEPYSFAVLVTALLGCA